MTQQLDELVEDLMREQTIEYNRPSENPGAMKESFDRGYGHIVFKASGTKIGVQFYKPDCHWEDADFDAAKGIVKIAGGLTLNYTKVKCVANIDLSKCEGTGYLVPVADEEYKRIMGL